MTDDENKDVAAFGFKRDGIRNKRGARTLMILALAAVAVAVWFVIFHH